MNDVRILFCGDRHWQNIEFIKLVYNLLADNLGGFVMIEGEADGADSLSRKVCEARNGKFIPFYPHWEHHFKHHLRCKRNCDRPLCLPSCKEVCGRPAGPIRNTKMLLEGNPHGVVAFHHDLTKSKGTANMVGQARKANLPIWVSSEDNQALFNFIFKMKVIQQKINKNL